jgi:hypothetical protein
MHLFFQTPFVPVSPGTSFVPISISHRRNEGQVRDSAGTEPVRDSGTTHIYMRVPVSLDHCTRNNPERIHGPRTARNDVSSYPYVTKESTLVGPLLRFQGSSSPGPRIKIHHHMPNAKTASL